MGSRRGMKIARTVGFGRNKVLKISRSETISDFEKKQEDFECDSLVNGKPVKGLKDWCDVFLEFCSDN